MLRKKGKKERETEREKGNGTEKTKMNIILTNMENEHDTTTLEQKKQARREKAVGVLPL